MTRDEIIAAIRTNTVIIEHSRSKNGVASLAYDPAIRHFSGRWMRGLHPRMTTDDFIKCAVRKLSESEA